MGKYLHCVNLVLFISKAKFFNIMYIFIAMTSLNNHILFSLAVRNRLPKPDGSSYKLQFDKIFDARSIFQKKNPKREKKSSNHSMYFFNCRSGVVCPNRTDQVISCNFTNFLMRARFFYKLLQKKQKKNSSNHNV